MLSLRAQRTFPIEAQETLEVTFFCAEGGAVFHRVDIQGRIGRQPAQVKITAGSDLATVSNMEVGSNVIDGKKSVVSLRATSIYRKENGQWKMIGHHTDLIPAMEKK